MVQLFRIVTLILFRIAIPNSYSEYTIPNSFGLTIPNTYSEYTIPNSFGLTIPNSYSEHTIPNSFGLSIPNALFRIVRLVGVFTFSHFGPRWDDVFQVFTVVRCLA